MAEEDVLGQEPVWVSRPRGSAMRLLVVDDEPAVADMIRELLVPAGHEIDVVHNGADAIVQARGEHYDGLILDVRMPDMSGLDVFTALRLFDCRVTQHTLFVGTRAGHRLQKTIASLGRPMLKKPFEATELVAALGELGTSR